MLPIMELLTLQEDDTQPYVLSKLEILLSEFKQNSPNIEALFKEQQSRIFEFFAHKDSSLMNSIRSEFNDNKSHTFNTLSPLLDELHNSQNSSKKGGISENKALRSLINAFPKEYIKDTHKLTASGDFIVEHVDCGKILIENKDYSENVPTSETDKFLRDMQNQNSHGIFISQKSGIANKENFQIQIIDNKVAVYLHKVNYDHLPILFATTIIKSLKIIAEKSLCLSSSDISDEQLLEFFNEWKSFRENKNKIITNLQTQIKSLKELSLPSFDSFLASKFNIETPPSYNCMVCGQSCRTKAALISHNKSKHPPIPVVE
jgi:hypothetical protein